MKKSIALLLCLAVLCALAACGREDPYRVDTVVRIPVNPTEAPVQTQPAPETEAPTQPAETEKPEEETKSAEKKPSGSKNNSNKKPASESKPTEPPVTEAPATEPPATEPPATEPPATEPPVTEPAATVPETPYDPSSYTVGSLEYAILAQINAARTAEGLPELNLSTRLCGIAALRAEEVSRVWSHNRPAGSYYTSILAEYGYGYSTSAEHLCYASGSGDGAAIVTKWLSAENRDSLLDGSFATAGIGVYRSGGVTYVACILIG